MGDPERAIDERYAALRRTDGMPFTRRRCRARAWPLRRGRSARSSRCTDGETLDLGGRHVDAARGRPATAPGHTAAWVAADALLAAADAAMGEAIPDRRRATRYIPPMYAPPATTAPPSRGWRRCPMRVPADGPRAGARRGRRTAAVPGRAGRLRPHRARSCARRCWPGPATLLAALRARPRGARQPARRPRGDAGDDRRRPPRRARAAGAAVVDARAAAHLPERRVRIAELRTTVVAVPQKRTYQSTLAAQGPRRDRAPGRAGRAGHRRGPGRHRRGAGGLGRQRRGHARDDRGGRAAGGRAPTPLEPDVVRRRLYAETGMAHLGTQGISWALSGIDTALWDLAGPRGSASRCTGCGAEPGGRARRSTPTSCPTSRSAWPRTRARGWTAGFRTLYLKVGFDPARRRGAGARGPRGGRRRAAHPHRRQRRLVAGRSR